ncbi:hypothetical protein [Zooshikella harenae]|uniref:Uncharacterized protein n=1 Tax=Zooshikella harenae TaxID=2827238 RepID=A0ABS5ZBE1_9GAMM|nr:hypothetical protein [Zooshikella harenae]MBU2711379.1 hypothetical protein [Zooshikella harenae]
MLVNFITFLFWVRKKLTILLRCSKPVSLLVVVIQLMGCNTAESLFEKNNIDEPKIPIAIGVMTGEQYSNFCNFMLENDANYFNPRQPQTWKFIFTRFANGSEAKMVINGRLRRLQLAEIRDQFEKFTVRDEPTISVELIKNKTGNTLNYMEYHGQLTIRQFSGQLTFDVVGSCQV